MNKKNLILGGVLVVLIAIAYVYQGPLKSWQANLGKPANFLAKLDKDKIDKIEITDKGEAFGIEKTGDKWKISNTKEFYLKDKAIANLFSRLEDAAKAEIELVSENKDKKSEFNTDESGTGVKLMQGSEVLFGFTIGKLSSDYSSTYVSQDDSSKTYAVKAVINNVFSKDSLYNKEIFNTEPDNITRLRFQYPTREFTVEREIIKPAGKEATSTKLGEWKGVKPYSFNVDQDKTEKVLNILSKLNAAKIPEQTFDNTGLEKNLIIVQASGDGVDNTIMVGDDNGNGFYFAKRGDSDNIYLITKEERDTLDQTIRSLK